MSDESKLVLIVAAVVTVAIVVSVFLIALLVVAWKDAEKDMRETQQYRIDKLVDSTMLEKLSKGRYTIDVVLFDRNETKLHFESVCAHKIIDGVLSVVQTNKHITYLSMDNVEYVNAAPYAQPKPTMTKGSNDDVD